MSKLSNIIKEYKDELMFNVDWPSFEELQSNSITVLVACFILAIIIFITDVVFKTSLTQLYGLFS